jgi:hypothetical protein
MLSAADEDWRTEASPSVKPNRAVGPAEELRAYVVHCEESASIPVTLTEKGVMVVDAEQELPDQTPPKALPLPASCQSRQTLSMNA